MILENKSTVEPADVGINAVALSGVTTGKWIETNGVSMLTIHYKLVDADNSVTMLFFEMDGNPSGPSASTNAFVVQGQQVVPGATYMEATLLPVQYRKVPPGGGGSYGSFVVPVCSPRVRIRIPAATGGAAADLLTVWVTKIMGV
jgi:hypothetical protein